MAIVRSNYKSFFLKKFKNGLRKYFASSDPLDVINRSDKSKMFNKANYFLPKKAAIYLDAILPRWKFVGVKIGKIFCNRCSMFTDQNNRHPSISVKVKPELKSSKE